MKSAVLHARDAYNAAIAARDPDAIAEHLAEDYTLVTSHGVALEGREAVHRNWVAKFERDADVVYTRTPESVVVDDAAGTAREAGRWHGHYSNGDARIDGAGTYTANWRRDGDGKWRLTAERFTRG